MLWLLLSAYCQVLSGNCPKTLCISCIISIFFTVLKSDNGIFVFSAAFILQGGIRMI